MSQLYHCCQTRITSELPREHSIITSEGESETKHYYYRTGVVGAIAILQALLQRAENGGDYNVDLSLNQFNLWYLGLGLHDEVTTQTLLSRHPKFKPRHDTELFKLLNMTQSTCLEATGTEPGALFDPARWTTDSIRWGKEGEQARYLDWTKLVTFDTKDGAEPLSLSFERGSCIPGGDEPVWKCH
jgi:hypothetical protein